MMQFKSWIQLMRLDKPVGIGLLLWPTLSALWLAFPLQPPLPWILIFTLGTVLMRTAGCVMNDLMDRDIDGHVKRTQERPLAAGVLSSRAAWALLSVLLSFALALLLWLPSSCWWVGVVAAVLALGYPCCKRFFYAPQLVLGLAFASAIPLVFFAVRGHMTWAAWVLTFATVLWALIYDTLYAMVDRSDDLKLSLYSTAILWGRYDRLMIGVLSTAWLSLWFYLGKLQGLGWHGQMLWAFCVLACCWIQWRIRHQDPAACFQAFKFHQGLGLLLFLGLL